MFQILNVVPFFFDFFEPGGTDHLLPGRPLEKALQFDRPRDSGFFVSLTSINAAFVHPDNTLTQRPLGQFLAWAGVVSPNTLLCRVRLTDENMDDAVHIQISGVVVLFG
jgi:hypothetical protein